MMRMKMYKKMYNVNVGYKYYIATDSNISDMSLLHGMNTQQCLLTQVSIESKDFRYEVTSQKSSSDHCRHIHCSTQPDLPHTVSQSLVCIPSHQSVALFSTGCLCNADNNGFVHRLSHPEQSSHC